MKKIFGLFIILFILTGCQSNDFIYKGDSDYWYAEVFVQQIDTRQEQSYKLKYNGEDLEAVKNMDITFSIQSRSGNMGPTTRKLSDSGTLESESTNACVGCTFLNENDEIIFTVELNNKEEVIILTN